MTTLTYGEASSCLLQVAEATVLRPQSTQALSLEQIPAEVRGQLAEPIHFPPLAQTTVPGDNAVLVVAPGIPQELAVINGALKALRDAGVEDSLITVLLACSPAHAEKRKAELAAFGHCDCQVKIHEPENENEIAFLGVSQTGVALRLNRVLCEADLVLPVTVATGELSPGAGLFPVFSDRETQQRFSAARAEQFPALPPENVLEAEECGRQLGAGLLLQVVPAPGGQVAAIIAGDPASVAKQGQGKYREVWCSDFCVRGNLVIATLTGEADQQTWQNVGHALAAAEAVLEPGGCIAICSELAESPGLALSQLFGNDEYDVVRREIQQNLGTDSGSAMQLCQTLERGTVYLLSKLNPSVVESLGMTPLESDSELEHLAETLRPCVVLEESQRLLPSVVEVEA